MVRRLTGRSLSFGKAVLAVLAGVAAASMTPARTVDLAKPLLLRRSHGTSLAAGAGAVAVERLLDDIALVVLFGVSLVTVPLARDVRFRPVVAAAGLLLTGGALILLTPRALRIAGAMGVRLLAWTPGVQAIVQRAGNAFLTGLTTWRASSTILSLAALSVIGAALEAARLAAVAAAVGASMSIMGAMLVFSAANLIAIAASGQAEEVLPNG